MKQQLKKLPYYLFYLFSFITIQACSGGSSGGSNDIPTDPGNPGNNYSISVDNDSIITRSEIRTPSTESFDINITFEGDGLLVGFAPGTGEVPWAEYQLTNVTATSAKLTVNIVDIENLTFVGTSTTTLRLTTGSVGTQEFAYQDVVISLELWQLETATTALDYTETFGAVSIPTQSFDLISSSVAWTASANVPWLTLDIMSGNENQTITATVNPAHTAITEAGYYDAIITITETASSTMTEIPVSLALDSIRLISNYPAMSLYKLTDQAQLSQSVEITNNSENSLQWQAIANVDWLTVDVNANTLNVTKNATVLADGQHNAVVSLSSISNGVAKTTTINVGYHQSSSAASTVDLVDFDLTTVASIAFDPTRPLIYLAGNDKITTHHLFTGSVESTIATPITFSNLAISPSGEYLLASAIIDVDGTNQLQVYKLNLNTQALVKVDLPATTPITFMPDFIANINGEEIIITEAQEYATLDLVRHYWQLDEQFFISTIQQAANTNSVTMLRTESAINLPTESTIYTFDVTYNEFAENKISVDSPHKFTSVTYQDSAPTYFDISNDGSKIHTAQSDSETIDFDGTNFVENGVLHSVDLTTTIDVKLDSQNNSYYYRAVEIDDEEIVAIYSLTKYDSELNEIWVLDIDNASGSSFILANFHRFVTKNQATDTWFVTSFPE